MKTNFYKKNTSRLDTSGGFTLLEMIVSSTIFIALTLIIVSSLISLENASRQERAIRTANDNLAAAIDSMSRHIRMGTKFHCGCGTGGDTTFPGSARNCQIDSTGTAAAGAQCFAFEGQSGDPSTTADQIVYRLNAGRIQRSQDGGATYINLTAPEVTISQLSFFVSGSEVVTPFMRQPLVTMILSGTMRVTARVVSNFNVQTSISARIPNYDI